MAQNDRVGDAYIDIKPRAEGFAPGVQAIINKVERDAKFAVQADTQQAQQAVQNLGNQIANQVGGGWQQAAVQAAAFTASVFGAKAAIEGVINQLGGLFDGLAKARAGFNSILGSKNGENLLSQVRQFAIDSPFVTGELVQYSQQLLGVGKAASTIVPTLKSVGDIVASVGGDTSNLGSILYALTQIQTIGKLTGQDARQLQNQLVPITKYIAEYTNKSVADVKKLQESGGIASDVVFAAIQNQGKKVEGALNNSVRTIQGAKSVLSDTVTALFQNSSLQTVFDDLVKGIQKVAAKLSEPEVQGRINSAIDAVTRVYKELKPVIAGFLEFGASTGFSGLKTLTITLGLLADVINAIPESALQIIGSAIAALAVLKAPLALVQYAQNIQHITTGLLGSNGLLAGLVKSNSGLTSQGKSAALAATSTRALAVAEAESALAAQKAGSGYQQMALNLDLVESSANSATVALEKQSLAFRAGEKLSFLKGKGKAVGVGLSAAALLGGQALQSGTASDNVNTQTAGGALTYGSIGYQLGGGYGAAAGAAYGALTSYLDATEEKLTKQIEKNRDLGKAAAEAYLKENEKVFAAGGPVGAALITTDLKAIKDQIDAINAASGKAPTEKELRDSYKSVDPSKNTTVSDKRKIDLATLEDQAKTLQEQYDKTAQPIIDAIKAASEFSPNAFYDQLNTGRPTGEGGQLGTAKSFDELDAAFRRYGRTTAEVAADPQGFVALVQQIESLDTAQQKAVFSANLFTEAIKNAGGDSAAIYANQIANIGTQLTVLNTLDAAKKAAISAGAPGQTTSGAQTSALTAQQSTFQAQQAARTLAYAQSIVATNKAITKATQEGNDVLVDRLKLNQVDVANAAAVAAEQNVLTEIYKAQTTALTDNVKARERAAAAAEKALVLTTLQGQAGALSSQTSATSAAVQSSLRPGDDAARYAAGIALIQAQDAAGAAASAKATASLRKTLDGLIESGFTTDSVLVKAVQEQIAITDETAKTTAAAQVLANVERDSALARTSYNAETVTFLTNLRKAQTDSAIIYGDEIAKAQALAGFISTVDSGASAAAAVFTGTSTLAEKAALNVAALTAAESQRNAAVAVGASGTVAAASAQSAYDSIIQASGTNILTLTANVESLNKANLGSAEGRNAVASVATQQVQDALANLATAETSLAAIKATSDKSRNQGGPTAAETAAAAEVFKQQHIIDILTGKSKDDIGILNGISSAAQALIQPSLDSAAAAKAKAAEEAAKKAADELAKYQEAIVSATSSLTDKLQSAADNIAAAARQWVGSIKERTQYEQATSVGSLTRNAGRQAKDLTEITSGLANLRARGVSQSVIDSLGINNVGDTKQVRKLVNSSDSDLAKLTTAVSERDALANTLATNEEQTKTKKTITEAILDAAKQLDIGTTKDQAAALAANINITTGLSAEDATRALLSALSGGKIG